MAENMEYMETSPENKEEQLGHVMIADDVISLIVAFAAVETKGVFALAGNITHENIGKTGRKALQKGVKVETAEGVVKAQISIIMDYGYNIPEVSAAVQEKVKSSVENMTGLVVSDINIQIAGVNVDNSKK